MSAWIYLFVAALFEVGWPVGFKIAAMSLHKIIWICFSALAMTLSGVFLYLAQKQIPIGTAYAIWSGIGASCTFLIGVLLFHDEINVMRIAGIIFIIVGLILLKLGD